MKRLLPLVFVLNIFFAFGQPLMFVSSPALEQVLEYDLEGNFLGIINDSPIPKPYGILVQDLQTLLVSSSGTGNSVVKLVHDRDPETYLTAPGLETPDAMVLGPDGNIYVSLHDPAKVFRFEMKSGKFMGVFVDGTLLGVEDASGIAFGSANDFFLAGYGSGNILRFDGVTGDFLGEFAKVDGPGGLAFRDNILFVADSNRNAILRFDTITGESLGVFSKGDHLNGPWGIAFGPDDNLYVANFLGNSIEVFDGVSGDHIRTLANDGQLLEPAYIAFGNR